MSTEQHKNTSHRKSNERGDKDLIIISLRLQFPSGVSWWSSSVLATDSISPSCSTKPDRWSKTQVGFLSQEKNKGLKQREREFFFFPVQVLQAVFGCLLQSETQKFEPNNRRKKTLRLFFSAAIKVMKLYTQSMSPN